MRGRTTHLHEGTAGLLRAVRVTLGLATDARLADALGVAPPVIAKQKRYALAPSMLLRIHDATGIPVNQLRASAGLPTVAPFKKE